jgi:hypothetical protein
MNFWIYERQGIYWYGEQFSRSQEGLYSVWSEKSVTVVVEIYLTAVFNDKLYSVEWKDDK